MCADLAGPIGIKLPVQFQEVNEIDPSAAAKSEWCKTMGEAGKAFFKQHDNPNCVAMLIFADDKAHGVVMYNSNGIIGWRQLIACLREATERVDQEGKEAAKTASPLEISMMLKKLLDRPE